MQREKLTSCLHEALDEISTYILHENESIIVVGNYYWHTTCLSLIAKQVNLCDSCLLLLDNGMEQEAYILARSQFNNMLWINYLCDCKDDSRVKEYFYQPHVNQMKTARKIRKWVKQYRNELDERFTTSEYNIKLNSIINENKKCLEEVGLPDLRIKTISDLAEQDKTLRGMYITMYNEASQFEHSDNSIINNYRKKILEE